MGNDRPRPGTVVAPVSAKFAEVGFKLRCATDGLWLCALIPCALLSNLAYWKLYSQLYKVVSIVGVGLFLRSTCEILRERAGWPRTVPALFGVRLCCSALTSLLLLTLTEAGISFALCLAVITSAIYSPALKLFIERCPGCFTYGEATVVTQSLILYVVSFAANIKCLLETSVKDCQTISAFVVQAGIFAVLVTVAVSYQWAEEARKPHVFLGLLGSSFVLFVVVLPLVVIRTNTLAWIWQLVTEAATVICFWAVCCTLAVLWLLVNVKFNVSASSAGRKGFHFLIFLVFVAGLAHHSCFMFVSSGVAFAVLVVCETIRKLKMERMSGTLQMCFETFEDEKDEGQLALTPLYLMVGCAAPLWMYPFTFSKSIPLPALSGLLTVAIGDAAASIGGTYFGAHRWPGSAKTVEGSVCCLLSQALVLALLHSLEMVRIANLWWSCFVAVVSSLVEAHTDQIDNLILPLIAYALFSVAPR